MTIKGVIFDFNGTLLWDTPLHNQAWDQFLQNHQIRLTDQEKNERIHGKNNRDIFKGLFNRTINNKEISTFSEEKEKIYRDICLSTNIKLTEGAIDLFDFLKLAEISFTIATASGKENVLFFFELYGLNKWFDFNRIVFDDGTLQGKPKPDYFIKAMESIQQKPGDCLIFEDSLAGITAAEKARAGKIIIVNSINGNYNQFSHQIISHFNQVDRKLFEQ